MEQVKAQICENITMYAQKYDEEFSSHLPGFVTTVWNLLITTGSHVKYDQVISRSSVLAISTSCTHIIRACVTVFPVHYICM